MRLFGAWCREGTRPLLPWGTRVKALVDWPERGLELIAPLRTDLSETVRRSVANHLNDVAKSNPGLVTATVATWLSGDDPPDQKLVRHGLRTLVKRGDPKAMELLGFDTDAKVVVEAFTCEPGAITLGDTIELSATIRSTSNRDQQLVIDYVIDHPGAAGARSVKVFKWTNLRLAAGATEMLSKRSSDQTHQHPDLPRRPPWHRAAGGRAGGSRNRFRSDVGSSHQCRSRQSGAPARTLRRLMAGGLRSQGSEESLGDRLDDGRVVVPHRGRRAGGGGTRRR